VLVDRRFTVVPVTCLMLFQREVFGFIFLYISYLFLYKRCVNSKFTNSRVNIFFKKIYIKNMQENNTKHISIFEYLN
jgi:hypothetical protein